MDCLDIVKKKSTWLFDDDIRPYVFVRPENEIGQPGQKHRLDWFNHVNPIYKDPLDVDELAFADVIYSLEGRAFGPSNMAMPRWVFYDCAVMPGFVAGFAVKPSRLTPAMKEALSLLNYPALNSPVNSSTVLTPLKSMDDLDWVPISLFIIIPTMHKGEWVAHNLCSVNSLLPKEEQLYGLGFMSKAFGLWYANVEQCSGMTQWGSPALKLHSHFGHLEVLGAYAPVHSFAKTVTYRVQVNTHNWEQFFTKEPDLAFLENFGPAGFQIDPQDESSMLSFQKEIEQGKGPFYLNTSEVSAQSLKQPLNVYRSKAGDFLK
ncbi:MAG: hypothetical protein V4736_00160 [Bdellovibrionota bacterium]